MVTCTQDILLHTAVVPPHHVAPHPSTLSGCGCQMTRYGKPACTRFCPPTRTCSFTRGCEDQTSLSAQRSDQMLRASQPDWPLPFQLQTGGLSLHDNLNREEIHSCVRISMHHWSQQHDESWSRSLLPDPELSALKPKDYWSAGFLLRYLSCKRFLWSTILALVENKKKNRNTDALVL